MSNVSFNTVQNTQTRGNGVSSDLSAKNQNSQQTVKQGDTWESKAAENKTSVDNLKTLNPDLKALLYPSDKLNVPQQEKGVTQNSSSNSSSNAQSNSAADGKATAGEKAATQKLMSGLQNLTDAVAKQLVSASKNSSASSNSSSSATNNGKSVDKTQTSASAPSTEALQKTISKLVKTLVDKALKEVSGAIERATLPKEAVDKFAAMTAKQEAGQKGTQLDKVKIDGKDKMLVVRESGMHEVRDPADYNVKTVDEAMNVEKGIQETNDKIGKLAERRAKGEKDTLYDSVTVNGKPTVIQMSKKNDEVKLLNAESFKGAKGLDTPEALIKTAKTAEVMQDAVSDLKARRDAGEKGTLYGTATLKGETVEKKGGLFNMFNVKETKPDTNVLVKLNEDGSTGAADFAQYSAKDQGQAIKVDQAVDRLRDKQAKNPGTEVSEAVETGGKVRSGGFLGLFTGTDPEKITAKLDKDGNLSTDKNKDVAGFFEQVWGGLKSFAGIAAAFIPGLQPIAAAVNIGKAVESVAKGDVLGGLASGLGAAGGLVGGSVGKTLETAGKVGQGVNTIAQGGDVFSGALNIAGNFSQGSGSALIDGVSKSYDAVKSALTGKPLDAAAFLGQQIAPKQAENIDKAQNIYRGVQGAVNGQSPAEILSSALGAVGQFGDTGFKESVGKTKTVFDEIKSIQDSEKANNAVMNDVAEEVEN
jgi:hypothetical protein